MSSTPSARTGGRMDLPSLPPLPTHRRPLTAHASLTAAKAVDTPGFAASIRQASKAGSARDRRARGTSSLKATCSRKSTRSAGAREAAREHLHNGIGKRGGG
eukprot:5100100-Prymnesium_polylepis.1